MSLGAPLAAGARVLVRMPAWVGDALAVEPVLRALVAATGGGERLTVSLRRPLAPLFEGDAPPAVVRSAARWLLHDGRGGERLADWRGHDVALLLSGSFRGAWLARRAGIPRRVGWSRDGRGWLLTDRLRPMLERGGAPPGIGAPGRGRRPLPRPLTACAVELVGLLGVRVRDATPRLDPPERARAAVRHRLADLGLAPDEPFLLACVGARPGSAKGWPAEHWARLCALVEERARLAVVLAFGPGEEAAAERVAAGAGRLLRSFGPPAATLPELAALAARARLVVAADGGSRHVARAAGASPLCLFGPTDPRHTALGSDPARELRVPLPCGPCHRERCPLSGADEHRCMRALEPERVFAAVEACLAGGPR